MKLFAGQTEPRPVSQFLKSSFAKYSNRLIERWESHCVMPLKQHDRLLQLLYQSEYRYTYTMEQKACVYPLYVIKLTGRTREKLCVGLVPWHSLIITLTHVQA